MKKLQFATLLILFSFKALSQDSSMLIVLGLNKEHGWHFFNVQGKLLLKADGEHYSYSDRLLVKEEDYKYGFVNCNGEWVVKPKYDQAKNFVNGFAKVKKTHFWYFIDPGGNVVGNESFEDARDFSEGLAAVSVEGLWGYIDSLGNVAIAAEFEKAYEFHNRVATVRAKGKMCLIDKSGKIKVEPTNSYTYIAPLNENRMRVRLGDGLGSAPIEWGYIDTTGRRVILSNFVNAEDFVDGRARVRETGRLWGYIDTKGEYVIQPQFKVARDFENGFAAVNYEGKWGIIDTSGNWSVKPSYNGLRDFSNGFAAVEHKGKWGVIDSKGNWIIRPTYKYIKSLMFFAWAK